MLINVFEATVHEGMIVAEILLYTALNRKVTLHSYLDTDGECEDFTSWKHKWVHLFGENRPNTLRFWSFMATSV